MDLHYYTAGAVHVVQHASPAAARCTVAGGASSSSSSSSGILLFLKNSRSMTPITWQVAFSLHFNLAFSQWQWLVEHLLLLLVFCRS